MRYIVFFTCGRLYRVHGTEVIQRGLMNCIMHSILLFHANLAATNLALAVDTETGTNVKIVTQKA